MRELLRAAPVVFGLLCGLLGVAAGAAVGVVVSSKARATLLWVVAATSPLAAVVGASGSLLELLDSFRSVETVAADQKSRYLSEGISTAMEATTAGFVVAGLNAIIAVAAFLWAGRLTRRRMSDA